MTRRVLALWVVAASGCGYGVDCIPCISELVVEASLPAPGPQPLSVEVCDGLLCESASASSGECVATVPQLEFRVCLEGSTVTITRGEILSFVPPDAGPGRLVGLTVRDRDGAVLLMAEGRPDQRFEMHCGDFPCPQRSITF